MQCKICGACDQVCMTFKEGVVCKDCIIELYRLAHTYGWFKNVVPAK